MPPGPPAPPAPIQPYMPSRPSSAGNPPQGRTPRAPLPRFSPAPKQAIMRDGIRLSPEAIGCGEPHESAAHRGVWGARGNAPRRGRGCGGDINVGLSCDGTSLMLCSQQRPLRGAPALRDTCPTMRCAFMGFTTAYRLRRKPPCILHRESPTMHHASCLVEVAAWMSNDFYD